MSKIRKTLYNIGKKHIWFMNLMRLVRYAKGKIEYLPYLIKNKVDDKTIIFASYGAKSYACSPRALYEYMLSDDKYNDYKFIWAFKDSEKYKYLENNKNTTVVEFESKKYFNYLSSAKYWIFNYKIREFLSPRKEQVFLQCWHGTPLKRLGCDLLHFDNALNSMEGMKKRYRIEAQKFDYFLSPSAFASEKFISAWDLTSIGKQDIIIEKGYPRNDFLYNFTSEQAEEIKKSLGIENDGRKIILYAPTYRSNQHKSGVGYVYKEEVNFDKLSAELSDEFIILFRPHYFIANQFDFAKYSGFVYDVSDYDEISDLEVITDILVTDYSSVFFDYANLKRPMVFHMYDLEHYRDESNGFYIDVAELPGKITRTDEELISEIKRISKEFSYDEKYEIFNKKYNYLDDGQASRRVLSQVIG